MAVSHIKDDEFETAVLNADGPVLVDFWAEWCGPCKQIAPALDELSDEYAGKISIIKINIDENPEAPTTYGVRSIPTMMIFQDGHLNFLSIILAVVFPSESISKILSK